MNGYRLDVVDKKLHEQKVATLTRQLDTLAAEVRQARKVIESVEGHDWQCDFAAEELWKGARAAVDADPDLAARVK